jgi:hypothetical protein
MTRKELNQVTIAVEQQLQSQHRCRLSQLMYMWTGIMLN